MTSVAEAFGLGAVWATPVVAGTGEQGLVWRIETDRGSWAVKQMRGPVDEHRAATDVDIQRSVSAVVRVPLPVRTCAGRATLAGDEIGTPGFAFRVSEWVEMTDAEVTPGDLGRALAAVHRLALPPVHPLEAWYADVVPDDAWARLRADAVVAGAPWLPALESALPALAGLRSLAVPVTDDPLITSHRDMNLVNVRRAADGELVVLDWDTCGPIVPARELAMVVAVQTLGATVERGVEVYRAYLAAGGPARLRRLSDFALMATVGDHLVQMYARRALDPDVGEAERAFASDRLAFLLAATEMVNVDRLSSLLDAVSAPVFAED